MNNINFDNSNLNELILNKVLPTEVIFKENDGDGTPSSLRHGRLNDDLIYTNRKVVTTRYGKNPITPQVKIYFRAFTDNDCILTIDIFNYHHKDLFKKFTIKSLNNNYTIDDMKKLINKIKNLLDDDKASIVSLIELIRNTENLKYQEISQ